MKKIIFIFISLLLSCSHLYAETYKSWSNNDSLKWEDFISTEIIPGSPHSSFKGNIAVETERSSINGHDYVKLIATAVMDCERSYADSIARKDSDRLKMHQLEFDLLESYRRDFQKDLNGGLSGTTAQQRMNYYNNLFNINAEKLRDQCADGKNSVGMENWATAIHERYYEQGIPEISTLTESPFSFAFNVGIGMDCANNSIHSAFSNTWAFTIGLQGGYKRTKLKFDVIYGQPKISEPNVLDIPLQEATDTHANYLGLSLAAGYSVVDTKRFSITPYFGLGYNRYGWNVGNYHLDDEGKKVFDSHESLSLSSVSWYGAIAFEYHINSNSPYNSGLIGNQRSYRSSVRLTPYISGGDYNKIPSLKGLHFGFSVAYVGLFHALKH